MTTAVIAGLIGGVAAMIWADVRPTEQLGESIVAAAIGFVGGALIVGVPVFFILKLTVGRRTADEGAKTDHPAVKALEKEGWSASG